MKIGSLFSGVGGLELGLEWAGVGHTVWQVESDAYCRGVLARHWPDATRFHDVRTVGATNLPAVDVICGGFPCQDISLAGKGAGLNGDRSGLWYEYLRIVRELGPRYVVVENVRALVVRGLDAVLGGLADCGYDAEWSCLSAREVGAPHRRDRLFIVAWRAGVADAERAERWPFCRARNGLAREDAVSQRQEGADRPGSSREDVADAAFDGRRPWGAGDASEESRGRQPRRSGERAHLADSERLGELQPDGGISDERRRAGDGCWSSGEPYTGDWRAEPGVGRVAHGVPARVDRLRALGNAVVPQCADVVGQRLMAIDAEQRRVAA